MDVLGLVAANLGLAIFSAVAFVLMAYLAYSMLRPEAL